MYFKLFVKFFFLLFYSWFFSSTPPFFVQIFVLNNGFLWIFQEFHGKADISAFSPLQNKNIRKTPENENETKPFFLHYDVIDISVVVCVFCSRSVFTLLLFVYNTHHVKSNMQLLLLFFSSVCSALLYLLLNAYYFNTHRLCSRWLMWPFSCNTHRHKQTHTHRKSQRISAVRFAGPCMCVRS